jgi:hypothetical protein
LRNLVRAVDAAEWTENFVKLKALALSVLGRKRASTFGASYAVSERARGEDIILWFSL